MKRLVDPFRLAPLRDLVELLIWSGHTFCMGCEEWFNARVYAICPKCSDMPTQEGASDDVTRCNRAVA
jgi:hypothetical protein